MAAPTPATIVPTRLADEPVPFMQQLLDNPFLLLFLGVAMPTVLYIVWGVMEIVEHARSRSEPRAGGRP